jgi:hypothetical protein
MDELKRLGRPGAYRLGDLRALGDGPVQPQAARPMFARARRRGPLSAWVLAFAAGVVAAAAGALAGLFFVPFVVGLLAGLIARWSGWRPRAVLAAAAASAVIGWGLPMGWHALRARLPGAPAPVVAGVAGALGLPEHGARGIVATLLAGIVLALGGAGLGQVLAALWARRARVPAEDPQPDRRADTADMVRLLAASPGRPGAAGRQRAPR